MNYEPILMLAIGLAVCFFGYRIKKIAFFLIWFILGYILMTKLMPFINTQVPPIAASRLYQILLPIAGGLLLSLLGFSIEKLCVSGIVFLLTILITLHYFGSAPLTLAIGGVVGVLLGALAIRLMKPAIILATAGAGAYAITLSVFSLFPELNQALFFLPLIVALAAVGAIIQFVTTKRSL